MSLIQGTLIPPTRVYRDSQGNFAGTSTDITPAMILLCRIWGYLYLLRIILIPLLAPVYLIFVKWYSVKFDKVNMKEDPKGWPIRKKKMLRKYTSIFILWCFWMLYGYLNDWQISDPDSYYTQPVHHEPAPVYDYNGKKVWDPEWEY